MRYMIPPTLYKLIPSPICWTNVAEYPWWATSRRMVFWTWMVIFCFLVSVLYTSSFYVSSGSQIIARNTLVEIHWTISNILDFQREQEAISFHILDAHDFPNKLFTRSIFDRDVVSDFHFHFLFFIVRFLFLYYTDRLFCCQYLRKYFYR